MDVLNQLKDAKDDSCDSWHCREECIHAEAFAEIVRLRAEIGVKDSRIAWLEGWKGEVEKHDHTIPLAEDERLRKALKVAHSLTRAGVAERFLRDAFADVHLHIAESLGVDVLPEGDD